MLILWLIIRYPKDRGGEELVTGHTSLGAQVDFRPNMPIG